MQVLRKIKEYEQTGRFDEDVEQDPPTRQLEVGEVDFLRKKLSSKIKAKFAFKMAYKFVGKLQKENKFILKEIKGIENFQNLKSGAVITCNHFNAFDSFAIHLTYDAAKQKKRKFFRVIREGNYTSFPGFYGNLMRNCYTLPLSSNQKVMNEFMKATGQLLKDGHFVLVYPEQSMWWNYRKPKPLKKGAFLFAAKNNVPVLPCFITMEDSKFIDDDGFPVQEYTVHVSEPIYPDKDLKLNANIDNMMEVNYQNWKYIYENVYGKKLVYETDNRKY